MNNHAFAIFTGIVAVIVLVALIVYLFRRTWEKNKIEGAQAALWLVDVAEISVKGFETGADELTDQLIGYSLSGNFAAKGKVLNQIYRHLEALAAARLYLPSDASELLADYSGLKADDRDVLAFGAAVARFDVCSRRLESAVALESLLSRQQEDLNSFAIRADLHLTNLARASALSAREKAENNKFDATVNMVKSFYASADLFKTKWLAQVANLIERYPMVKTWPLSENLQRLEQLPNDLEYSTGLLQKALASIA